MVVGEFKAWTIADHIREMHAWGVSPEMIAWRMKMKMETILRWLDNDDK